MGSRGAAWEANRRWRRAFGRPARHPRPPDPEGAARPDQDVRDSRNATARRGPIALIESKSGHVVGTCEIIQVVGPLTLAELQSHPRRCGFRPSHLPYPTTYAWVLRDARRLPEPVPCQHPGSGDLGQAGDERCSAPATSTRGYVIAIIFSCPFDDLCLAIIESLVVVILCVEIGSGIACLLCPASTWRPGKTRGSLGVPFAAQRTERQNRQ
jgi:hypothetical protein